MAHFLRDERIQNVSIDETALRELHRVANERAALVPERAEGKPDVPDVFVFTIIRFDDKGYRLFSLDEVLQHFHTATAVERVIVTIESGPALRNGRAFGSLVELRLDARDADSCLLTVTSDQRDWVDATFAAFKDVLRGCANRNGYARTGWTAALIQLSGVIAAFALSLWAAVVVSPRLGIDNAFFIAFLFSLLVFSNLWTYVSQQIFAFIARVFPNVHFARPDRDTLHWLLQALVGGIVVAIALWVLNVVFNYVGSVLGSALAGGA